MNLAILVLFQEITLKNEQKRLCTRLCCRMILSGAAKPAGKAELWHGPGDLWGGAAEGAGLIPLAVRLLSQAWALLPSAISGSLHLSECMSCFFLQAEELCSAPSPCCREVACR